MTDESETVASSFRATPLQDPMEVPLSGSHLIEAGAGTGKTYQLTGLYLRLLVERDFPVDRILAVTFTRAATQELSGRVRARLALLKDAFGGRGSGGDKLVEDLAAKHPQDGPGRVERALRHFDEAAIYTIHGFCQRVLAAAAFESGAAYGVELAAETGDFVGSAARDFYRANFYDAPEEFLLFAQNPRKEKSGGNKKPAPIGPNRFEKLISAYLRHSSIIVEGRTERPELSALVPFREIVETVKEAWPAHRDEVTALLMAGLAEKRLNGNKYKDTAVYGMIRDMDAWCAGEAPVFPLFERFGKFGATTLANAKNKGFEPLAHPFFELCEKAWAHGADLMSQCGRLLEHFDASLIPFAVEALRRAKEKKNVQFYNDLVSSLARALEGPGGEPAAAAVGARFDCALIDEFQDTDPDQYAIFQALFARQGKPLFLIGDPKQAIYAFRGADVFSYLGAAGDAAHIHTLIHNRRSDPALIDGVNAVFHREGEDGGVWLKAPFVLSGIGFTPAQAAAGMKRPELRLPEKLAPLEIWLLGPGEKGPLEAEIARKRIIEAVTSRITQLVDWGRRGLASLGDEPLGERHVAVLVRSHPEARQVETSLRRAGLNCVRISTETLFYTGEAAEMLALLKAVSRPNDNGAVRAALATETLGRKAGDLAALIENPEEFGPVTEKFRWWRSIWASKGFAPFFRTAMRDESVFPRLLALNDGERRVTNLMHLAEVLEKTGRERALGPEALAGWLSRAMSGREEGGDELLLRLESDEDAVKVVTVHASKGLEYPIVFSPFLFSGLKIDPPKIFHDPARNNRLVMWLWETGDDFNIKKESLAEKVRLCYVALTRARNLCAFAWGPINRAGNGALAWLLHGPSDQGDDALFRWLEGANDRMKGLSQSDVERALAPLVLASGGAAALCTPPEGLTPLPPAPGPSGQSLSGRKFNGKIDSTFSITSYSALASGGGHDEAPETGDAPMFPWEYETGPAKEGPPDIFDFPKGAGAGQFFHDLLENWDFTCDDSARLGAHVTERLLAHGFSGDWEPAVSEMVKRLVSAPLSENFPGLTLSKIGPSHRVDEMEFTFPLSLVTPGKLAAAFAGSPIMSLVPDRFEALGFYEAKGFLHGFADMIFFHEGKYFLVDWKSNHLGGRPGDYGQEAMRRAMAAHHYTLQYHLYVLALNRHLGLRLKGYDYDSHFGGVFYVFLRGASEGHGVFFDRPGKRLILRLENALLDATAAAAERSGA